MRAPSTQARQSGVNCRSIISSMDAVRTELAKAIGEAKDTLRQVRRRYALSIGFHCLTGGIYALIALRMASRRVSMPLWYEALVIFLIVGCVFLLSRWVQRSSYWKQFSEAEAKVAAAELNVMGATIRK